MSNRKRLSKIAAHLGSAALLVLLAGCMGEAPQSTLHLNSDLAREVMGVYSLVTWITCIIGVVVFGLLVYVILRFHDKGEAGLPEQIHGNTRLEIGWTLVPLVLVIIMSAATIRTIFAYSAPAPEGAVKIRAIGKQWWWEFEYPEHGVITANEVHIPVGQAVDFEIQSADVIHSLWVPQFGGKRDAIPGRTNHLVFTAEKPGVYVGQCAEYCGDSHALMELRVIAHEPAEFEAWIEEQKKPAPAELTASSHPGAQAFLNAGCIACHTIRGNPVAAGRIGPDLTHVGSRMTLGSGMMENTPENMKRWLADPQGVKPGALMVLPRKLTEQEVDVLTDYLGQLK